MRRLWALVALGLVGTLVIPAVAVAGGDPFTRSWSRVDVDGSREALGFAGGGATKTWHYRDERATACGGGPFEGSGTAVVEGNLATFDGTAGCVGGPTDPAGGTFVYDPGSGTIDDGSGLAWHRGGAAREAFAGVWRATDNDGSAMKLAFDGEGLERDVTYVDSIATSCDPDAVFMSEGAGILGSTAGQGASITVSLVGGCLGGDASTYVEVYRYDVQTDTLRGPLDLDGSETPFAVDWHRG